jgi:uncharacterized protein
VLSIRTALRADLTAALKTRDRIAAAALRSALAAIDNAEAVPVDGAPVAGEGAVAGAVIGVGAAEVARRGLTEVDVRAILAGEVQERRTAAAEYERLGRAERATQLRAEADVLGRHLQA